MPRCPKCGQEITGGKTVCVHCGEKLGNIQAGIQTQNKISIITDDDIMSSKVKDTGERPISGMISLVTSIMALIAIGIFLSLGMHHAGDEGWAASTIGTLFIIMAFAITGIMSGLIGMNHPKKLPSIIGLVCGTVFTVILGYVIASSMK